MLLVQRLSFVFTTGVCWGVCWRLLGVVLSLACNQFIIAGSQGSFVFFAYRSRLLGKLRVLNICCLVFASTLFPLMWICSIHSIQVSLYFQTFVSYHLFEDPFFEGSVHSKCLFDVPISQTQSNAHTHQTWSAERI